tara:strand:+ start:447 stop:758 length:312 start_codon:yes stop_codon:yes gene_type:complete
MVRRPAGTRPDLRGSGCRHDFQGEAWPRDGLFVCQPSLSGSDAGSFICDAHRRRVRRVINGGAVYSVYPSSGAMVFRRNATPGEITDYLSLFSTLSRSRPDAV